MGERDLISAILLGASRVGARLFRQNVAKAWIGQAEVQARGGMVRVSAGDVVVRQARRLHAGLCVGSSDIIGWTPVTVTHEMVGRQVAVFTALEVKTGRVPVTPEQKAFVAAVCDGGGYAMVVRSLDDALAVLKR